MFVETMVPFNGENIAAVQIQSYDKLYSKPEELNGKSTVSTESAS